MSTSAFCHVVSALNWHHSNPVTELLMYKWYFCVTFFSYVALQSIHLLQRSRDTNGWKIQQFDIGGYWLRSEKQQVLHVACNLYAIRVQLTHF